MTTDDVEKTLTDQLSLGYIEFEFLAQHSASSYILEKNHILRKLRVNSP